jgi:solute:Na+ symporter, SSS family
MEYLLFSLVYFAAMAFLGVLFSRKIQGLEGYFLASRRLSGFAVFLSLAASWIGATSVLISVDEASRRGISAFWVMGVPAVLTVMVFALFLAGKIRRLSIISLPELVERRYGRTVRHLSAVLIIWYMILLSASQMVAAGKFLHIIFGTSYILGLMLGVGIVILYSALGGYLSVVVTDAVQFALLAAALVVVLIYFGHSYSLAEIIAKLGEREVPFWDFFLDFKKNSLIALSFTLAWIISPIAWQRIQSARSVPHARRGLWMAAAVFFIFYWGLIGVGLGAAVSPPLFWLNLGGAAGGFVLVAVAAAIMSTMDTAINTGALSLTRDIYQEVWVSAHEYPIVQVSRFSTLIIGVAAFIIATQVPSILTTLGLASEIMTVGLFIPGIFMLYIKKPRPSAGLLGLGCGSLYSFFGFFCQIGLLPLEWPEWPYSVPGGLAVCAAGFAAGWIWDSIA